MSDSADSAVAEVDGANTAGGLLRRARLAQGLHIAALASTIKVVPRKLELLESNQFEQLPDATFTRALAQAVCRTLKIDPAPVLALLPPLHGQQRLEQVAEGLKTPFHERPGRLVPKEWAMVTRPVLWFAAFLLLAALVVYLAPAGWLPFPQPAVTRSAPAPAPADAPPQVVQVVPLPALPGADAAASALLASVEPPVPAPTGVLQLRASAPSWVEVTDARGQPVLSRLLQAGENVGVDGAMPLKVRIGNASGTGVVFRGQPLELAAFTRDNIARLELK